eukprot:1189223-Prorocentrum_minimum.AAC.3
MVTMNTRAYFEKVGSLGPYAVRVSSLPGSRWIRIVALSSQNRPWNRVALSSHATTGKVPLSYLPVGDWDVPCETFWAMSPCVELPTVSALVGPLLDTSTHLRYVYSYIIYNPWFLPVRCCRLVRLAGSTDGIGKETATTLARNHKHLVVVHGKSSERVAATVKHIKVSALIHRSVSADLNPKTSKSAR